jgi:hypothetical protein
MAHKQIGPLKGQLAQVNRYLKRFGELEQEAPKAPANAIFPVAMRATSTADLIADGRLLLERAAARLQAGIDFFVESDRQLEELAKKGDEAKDEIAALTAETNVQEGFYVGHSAASISILAAASSLIPKIEEGIPSYR